MVTMVSKDPLQMDKQPQGTSLSPVSLFGMRPGSNTLHLCLLVLGYLGLPGRVLGASLEPVGPDGASEARLGLALPASVTRGPAATTAVTMAATITRTSDTVYSASEATGISLATSQDKAVAF